MKAIYITSLHKFSGKTALSLALGRRLQKEGYKVGYFKPVSAHPWEPIPGRVYDEDATFVRKMLGLQDPLADMVGVVLTSNLLKEMRCGCTERDLMPQVKAAYERVAEGKDVVIVEGGSSLREGMSIGLDPRHVAKSLELPILAMVRYRNRLSMSDACVAAKKQLKKRLLGIVVNGIPDDVHEELDEGCLSCLEEEKVPVFGSLPQREELQAISAAEIAEVLDGEFLAAKDKKDVLLENLIVGAMSAEQALPRIRRTAGSKAVITGGDRADIQLVALETATKCLILTGYLRPVPEVLRRADEIGVPVLLVRKNTMETVDAIDDIFGKTRLGQAAKLEQFETILEEHFDYKRLYESLKLSITE